MAAINLHKIREMKKAGEKITVLTAYDYPTARILDQEDVDIILVGDSLGMVVLGYPDTLAVTVDDMIHHAKAVVRGTSRALVVVDMPFMSFQVSPEKALEAAGRIIKESGARAVKLEGGVEVVPQVEKIVGAGIPVMGHVGLKPQSVHKVGGYRVQGRGDEAARALIADAEAIEAAGAFSVVLECVPASLAAEVSARLTIPTIGIGAGPSCDGQVLVFHDIAGLYDRIAPKFVKRYTEAGTILRQAVSNYARDVRQGAFPGPEHTFKD